MNYDSIKLDEFLLRYPEMSISPSRDNTLILRGNFRFSATHQNENEITDVYNIEIKVPNTFPKDIPIVKERNKKIPKYGSYHVNYDASICLGSPITLIKKINENPTLSGFVESCLIPYLYAVSNKLKNGGKFIFGELEHGEDGLINDYSKFLNLNTREEIIHAIKLASSKKRIANKMSCPCCNKKLGKCNFRFIINDLRELASPNWFKNHLKEAFKKN
jgi:hypothetical protein